MSIEGPGLTRDQYLGMLEMDYYKRAKDEHNDERGLFGRVDYPKYLAGKDVPLIEDSLNDMLPNKLESIISDDSIIKEIDGQIKLIADQQSIRR